MFDGRCGAFLREMIVAAGGLLRSSLASGNVAGHSFDLITNRFIIDAIARAYPEHRYISEEEEGADDGGDALTWIIDPIDGSENFYRGILSYSISISLVRGEDILLGAVYVPYVDQLYFGEKGKGATLNGHPIRVSATSDVRSAVVAISRHTSFVRNGSDDERIFQKLVESLDVRIFSSTALDMCYVAAGAIEGRIMADTRIWDNSAATLLVREAGGLVTDWEGGLPKRISRKLVASNGLCHAAFLKYLNGGERCPQ